MHFSDRNYFAVAVVFYGLSTLYAVFLQRRGFRNDDRINYFLLLGGAAFHTLAMMERGFNLQRCPINNLYEAITFLLWTIVFSYLAIGIWSRLRFLGAFASPILLGIGVVALMPSLDPPYAAHPNFTGAWPSLHAALILLSYGAFGLSAISAAMYLRQERNLKFNKREVVFSLMPPIQRLDQTMTHLLGAGFALLTAGLLIGALWLKSTQGYYFSSDTKVLWSALVWLLGCGLLVARWRFAQRGRRFALGAIGMFVFVLLTFWGSNLLSVIHNPEPQVKTESRP